MMQYLFGDYYQEFKGFITFSSQELYYIFLKTTKVVLLENQKTGSLW